MRCYFMRKGHIVSVEILTRDASDSDMVKEAENLFAEKQGAGHLDGVEVWDKARFVHRYP